MSRLVLVTGCTGNMGSYLTEALLDRGDKVVGLIRRTSNADYSRISSIIGHKNFSVVSGDICDANCMTNLISRYKFDLIHNTAAQSHVAESFIQPSYTWEATGQSVLYMLEAIRNFSPHTRFITNSSSEMFGKNYSEDELGKFQDEKTELDSRSPYAIAKIAAHKAVGLYRDSYNLWAAGMITFNMESPRRTNTFVTRKITQYIGKLHNAIKNNKSIEKLKLGNIYSYRDWSYVPEIVEAYIKLSLLNKPVDLVVCSGETHSVAEFLEESFSLLELDWHDYVDIDESLKRPQEVDFLQGRATRAKEILGWEPQVKFKELVKIMVENDIELERAKQWS